MNKKNKEIEQLEKKISQLNIEKRNDVEKINKLRKKIKKKFEPEFKNSILNVSINSTFTKMEFDAKRMHNVLPEFGVLIDMRTNRIIKKVFENSAVIKDIDNLKELEKNIEKLINKIDIKKIKKILLEAKKIGKEISKKEKEYSKIKDQLTYLKNEEEFSIINKMVYFDSNINIYEVFNRLENEELNIVIMYLDRKIIWFRDVRIKKKKGKRKLYEVNGKITFKEKIKELLKKKITSKAGEIEYQQEIIELFKLPQTKKEHALAITVGEFSEIINETVLKNKVREF